MVQLQQRRSRIHDSSPEFDIKSKKPIGKSESAATGTKLAWKSNSGKILECAYFLRIYIAVFGWVGAQELS